MPFSIYQATWGRPFTINQTICQELRVDGGIAQPGLLNEDTHFSSACFLPFSLEIPVLSGMCSRRQIFTTQVPGTCLLQQQVLGTRPLPEERIS